MNRTARLASAFALLLMALCAPELHAHVADVGVAVGGQPSPVAVGDTITWVVNVNNTGPDDALGVIVTDQLASNTAFVAVTSAELRCTRSGTRINCTADTLPPGVPAARIFIRATAPASPTTIRNDVSIQAIGSTDPNDGNNANFITVQVISPTTCTGARPELTLPSQGAVNLYSPVQFAWSSVPGASGYRLYVGVDGAPPQMVLETSLTSGASSVTGASGQWFVESLFPSCPTTRSETRSFSIFTPSPLGIWTLGGKAGVSGATDGPREVATLNGPRGVAADPVRGGVVVADRLNHLIRHVALDGSVATLAGAAGSPGSADGAASTARFNFPSGVAVAPNGDIYVADTGNHTIRKISASGEVSTYAGTAGAAGAADGSGPAARFSSPESIALATNGTIFVADTANHAIRAISATRDATTFAGSAGAPGSANGEGPNARFNLPSGIALDPSGNLIVADSGNHLLRRIDQQRGVSTLAGSAGVPGSTDAAAENARFNTPTGVAVHANGTIFVTDKGNHTVRIVASGNAVGTVAGRAGAPGLLDGSGTNAQFNGPTGIAIDAGGRLFIADSGNHTIRSSAPPEQGGRRRPARR